MSYYSLLHDDFIDNSDFRRKQKTAWVQFSPQQAVLAGDYLLAQVNVYLCEKENLSLLKLTAESIKSLVRGEFLQREFYGFRQKDLEKINEVSEHKTGSLFKWCLKAPFILQGKQEAAFYDLLETIGRYLGWLYQRSDDLLDFDSQKESDKPALCDLKQTYYNSFSCYLTKDLDPSLEKKYQNCKSISEVHQCMPHFEATLKLFHEDNQKIIKKTEEKMMEISSFLAPEKSMLISELKLIPSLLYWRKK
ncbi:MAG: polyprenyl synthetase family protein [Bdellovibrionales bacterium]